MHWGTGFQGDPNPKAVACFATRGSAACCPISRPRSITSVDPFRVEALQILCFDLSLTRACSVLMVCLGVLRLSAMLGCFSRVGLALGLFALGLRTADPANLRAAHALTGFEGLTAPPISLEFRGPPPLRCS